MCTFSWLSTGIVILSYKLIKKQKVFLGNSRFDLRVVRFLSTTWLVETFNWPSVGHITLRAVINEVRKSHLYNLANKILSPFIHRLFASVALNPICLSSHNVAISVDGGASRNCWSGTKLRTPQPSWQACGKLNLSDYDRSKLCEIRGCTIEYLLDTVRVEGRLWDRWAMNSKRNKRSTCCNHRPESTNYCQIRFLIKKARRVFRVPGECQSLHGR